VNGLPAFTAYLAVSRGDAVLVAIERPVQAWQLRRWYEETLCVPGSPVLTCSGGTVCTASSSPQYSRDSVCCYPGRINCQGRCRDACAPGTQLNPLTCGCEVPCPPCPAVGMIQDPSTCLCRCPNPGEIPCRGVCIDPLTDETFCGGCPGTVCSPVDELCCNGVCTKIGTKQNCRDCGDQVPSDWDCCNFVPTQLGTRTNCLRCGDSCAGERECTPQGCRCDPSRIECPSGPSGICCPTTHKGCCNNQCTNLTTNALHCGACGHRCPPGASCVAGQCVCQPPTQACGNPNMFPFGGTCCAPGWSCQTISSDPPYTADCCQGNAAPGTLRLCPPSPARPNQPGGYCCPVNLTCCATGIGCC
jgi:hypothetical protein